MKRQGFTLVEMLVATALVVLMMLLFAQIFQTSGGIVSNQKGMAKNDQSVRTMTILLRGDIRQRTFVDVVPFVPNQDTDNAPSTYEAQFRQGFFSISENDANDNTDDVLHLTIRTDSPLAKSLRLPFSAKSRLLHPSPTPPDVDAYLRANPDQPEFDDGHTTVNNTGSSRYAEVCWFLRHGKLHRRILLIRDPYNRGGNVNPPEEPQDNAGNEFVDEFYDHDSDGSPDNFWRDFDYSAYWEPNSGLKFHTVDSLNNANLAAGGIVNLGGLPRSLGVPVLRFGSSTNRFKSGVIYPPREYITNGTQTRFIGRYTVQETADLEFKYPGSFVDNTDYIQNDPHNFPAGAAAAPNPRENPPGQALTIDSDTGLVSPYHDNTARRGEDIVMDNVHAFDVQVWDDGLSPPRFASLGHSGTTGHYRAVTPQHAFGNSYDTWHPSQFMPSDPPYAPFNGDRSTVPSRGLGDAGELPLKAISIKIRFWEDGSESMRDLTFTFPLNREQIGKK
jgi:prepilin-type N-terminal cleavage/methylation domain-containing protein